MPTGPERVVTALTGLALAAALSLLPAASAQAQPDIDEVQARVDQLFRQAERASERYNDARLRLTDLNRDLAALGADEKRQDRRLETARERLQDAMLQQYEGQSISALGQVVLAQESSSFVSEMSTMSAYSDLQEQLFDDYSTELKALGIRRDATEKRAEQIAKLKDRLAAEKRTIDDKFEQAKTLLGRLKAEEREQILSRGSQRPPADVPVSGRAAAAVRYAMAQVGDAYVWGAAGPDAFDCSGLTMMAWAQAGVALPHSSRAQSATGTRVAAADLRPGDLVFFYNPISHVSMYIGNGMIVDAANPGAGVRVASLSSMPYAGAVRPG